MTAIPLTTLPASIDAYLRRYSRRRALQRLVRRVGLAVFVTILWAFCWCLVDRMTALPPAIRAVLLVVNVLAAAAIVARAFVRIFRSPDRIHAAREIERRAPDWREKLATVVSRVLGPARFNGSPELLGALARNVADEAAHRRPADLLSWAGVFRPWIVALALAGLISPLSLVPTLDLPRLLKRYFTPLAPVAPAATTRLFVTPGDTHIPAGEPLRVRASAQRLGDSSLTLHLRAAGSGERDWAEQPMSSTADGAFEARVPNLQRDLEYFVTGGDARSDVYIAVVLRRPAVVAFHVTFNYPPYLKLPPRTFTSASGLIEAPLNTEITLDLQSSEPLSGAQVLLAGNAIATTPTDRADTRRAKFVARQSQSLEARLSSAAGVEGEFAGGQIRVMIDRPPVVALRASAGGRAVRANGTIALGYQAIDDFALNRLDAELSIPLMPQKIIPLPMTGDAREQQGVCVIDLAKLPLAAAQRIEVRLRAEDRAGQFTLSAPLALRIDAPAAAAAPAPSPAPPRPATSGPALQSTPAGFDHAINAYFEAINGM